MGSSSSCLYPSCSDHHKRQVMVMKDDGVIHRFKAGSHVRDVLVAHPSHQVIKCSSDRTRLPDSFRLSCNQLYFLLPKGVTRGDKSIEKLLRIAASRDPTLFVMVTSPNKKKTEDTTTALNSNVSSAAQPDGDFSSSNGEKDYHFIPRWKPALQTIPEVTLSSLLQADAWSA